MNRAFELGYEPFEWSFSTIAVIIKELSRGTIRPIVSILLFSLQKRKKRKEGGGYQWLSRKSTNWQLFVFLLYSPLLENNHFWNNSSPTLKWNSGGSLAPSASTFQTEQQWAQNQQEDWKKGKNHPTLLFTYKMKRKKIRKVS